MNNNHILKLGDQLLVNQTDIGNLVIFSRKNPSTLHSAYSYVKALSDLKKEKPIGALSLELDQCYQQILETLAASKTKANYRDFPNFAFSINYALKNDIPLYASDPLLLQSLTEIRDLDELLYSSLGGVNPRYEKIQQKRAESTSTRLKEICSTTQGIVAHLASYDQAQRLYTFLGTSFSR